MKEVLAPLSFCPALLPSPPKLNVEPSSEQSPFVSRLISLRALGSVSDLAQDTGTSVAGLGLVTIEDGKQGLPDLTGLLAGVNGLPDAGVLVVADDGRRLLVVGLETLAEGLGVVVGALHEGLASDVVLHGLLGRVEGQVVGTAGSGVDETARDARNKERVVDLELDGVLQGEVALAEHGVETLGLGNGAGEAVEDEAVCRE